MYVKVNNRNGIITNAWFDNNHPLVFHLYINTEEKHRLYDTVTTYFHYKEWIYYADDDSINYDSVCLIADHENDLKILNRLDFYLHDKNQLWVMLPDNSLVGF